MADFGTPAYFAVQAELHRRDQEMNARFAALVSADKPNEREIEQFMRDAEDRQREIQQRLKRDQAARAQQQFLRVLETAEQQLSGTAAAPLPGGRRWSS